MLLFSELNENCSQYTMDLKSSRNAFSISSYFSNPICSFGIACIRDLWIRIPSTSMSKGLEPNATCFLPRGNIMSWMIWSFVFPDGFCLSCNEEDIELELSREVIIDNNATSKFQTYYIDCIHKCIALYNVTNIQWMQQILI